MNDLVYSKVQMSGRPSDKGIYVKEDDQDWGSAGMNDVQQEDSE